MMIYTKSWNNEQKSGYGTLGSYISFIVAIGTAMHAHIIDKGKQDIENTYDAPHATYQDLEEYNRSPNSAHSLPIMQHLSDHSSSSVVSLVLWPSIMHNYDKDITS